MAINSERMIKNVTKDFIPVQLRSQSIWVFNKFVDEEIWGVDSHRDDPSGENGNGHSFELIEWGTDIGKILFNLCYVKHKQFDFSLLVNGKSTERKVFPSIL